MRARGSFRRSWTLTFAIAATLASFVACGSENTGEEPSPPGTGGGSGDKPPPSIGDQPPPPPVIAGGDCESGQFEVRKLGTARFENEDYEIVVATPCEYVLSHARKGVTYPIEETATHYIVDSHFELPYIPGVMDAVAFTPEKEAGDRNGGFALGLDVQAVVRQIGALPFLYHVRPGYEYGYFTDYDDDQGDIFGAFRPTWRFVENGGAVEMKLFAPPDTAWPRHRGGWNPKEINQEIGFGFFVDKNGKVHIPKNVPLARQKWETSPRCVVINKASAAVPVTRTQFPGDESYYMAETHLPGYASIDSPGHLYWGHKGKPMRDVAKWDETLPGNFDKPFGGGCSHEGYSVAHAEGFTWPELREKMRDRYLRGEIPAIPKEYLYKISVYVQKNESAPPELKGELHYEWDGDEWLPKASGDSLISIDKARNTYRISGYLPQGQRAFVVIEDL